MVAGAWARTGHQDAAAGFDAEALRKAAGTAARALAGTKKAALALPVDGPGALEAIGEGVLLGAYSFDSYKENNGKAKGARAKNGKAPLGEAVLLGGKPRDAAHRAPSPAPSRSARS
ncbi:protein of unknown function [Streptomyces murinus]|uniref:M17 family peptidase N-terminal domain-containing protein n=1 Tax=Streptomyces murinus TaxID=33900 RepID=UPI003D667A2C